MTLILTNEEVNDLLTIDLAIEALEHSFAQLALGKAVDRPRTRTFSPAGGPGRFYHINSMEGIVSSLGMAGIRLNSSIKNWVKHEGQLRAERDWDGRGERHSGLVMLFSSETGELLAFIPDNAISRIRVGCTYAIGSKYLARSDASSLGMLGSGRHARGVLRAHARVRPLKKIKVYSPTPAHREAYAVEMAKELGLEVQPVHTVREAIQGVDIVTAVTNAAEPIVFGDMLEPGMHVTSVNKVLDDSVFQRAAVAVTRSAATPQYYWCGEEVPHEVRQQRKPPPVAQTVELGELILGRVKGRTSPEQITVFGGLRDGGMGTQFVATGAMLYKVACERGVGREVPQEWFFAAVKSPFAGGD